jgi:hypothetical protein
MMLRGIAYAVAAASLVLGALSATRPACAQKSGGILKIYMPDSPASMSIHEEVIPPAQSPMMGVFNNLIMFDQHVKQSSLQTIVPDLATGWSWNEEGTALTLPVRQGIKWHDGKPFSAADVKCTWDLLLDEAPERLRVHPKRSWYRNLDRVSINGDYEVTFHLKRPQPAFPMLLADGFSAIYPCHVPPREMRQHPIQGVYFLDADNRIRPRLLQRLFNSLQDAGPEIGWAYPDVDKFGYSEFCDTSGPYSTLEHLFRNFCEAGSMAARRMLDAGVRFDETMRGGSEDWEFWLQGIEHGFRGTHVPAAGFRYRRRGESTLVKSERNYSPILEYIHTRHPRLFDVRALMRLEAAVSCHSAGFPGDIFLRY